MDLHVFIFILWILLGKLSIIAGNQCSDPDGDCLLGSLDVTGFFDLLLERFHDCAKLVLELQPGLDLHGLSWHFLVTVVVIIIILLIFVWRMVCTVKSTISRLKEDGNQILERFQAEQSKGQELEVENHLEQQAKIMQQNLDSKDLCQDSDSTVQQTSDSEHHDTDLEVKVKSLRQQIQEGEQERRRTEGLLRTEEGKLNMEKLQAEKRCKQLEEKIKKMECEQASMCSEKNHQETLNMILQEKLHIMHNLCQQKDQSLKQKLAQEEVEQCVNGIKADVPKNEIGNLKKKIQEINERNDKTQSALKTQIAVQRKKAQENWIVACASERTLGLERKEMANLSKKLMEVNAKLAGNQRQLFNATVNSADQQMRPLCDHGGVPSSVCNNVEDSEKIAAAVEERNLYLSKLQAEEIKTKNLDENIQDLKEDRKALKKETFSLQIEINSCNGQLHNMIELCQQKDQALQQQSRQALRTHKQKVKTIEEQHQKAELSYKAQIESLKNKLQENKMKVSGLVPRKKKEMANLHKQQEVSTSSHGSSDESLKLANAVEEEQHLYLEKLQAEERKTQEMEEKIQTLEQERDDLKNDKSQLELQTTTVQSELHIMTELCQQKEQALQQNAAQVKEVLMSHQQKIQTMEEQHRTKDLYYKAEIDSFKKKSLENLIKACSSENLLAVRKREITSLRKQLDKVSSELAEIQMLLSMPIPSCSYRETTTAKTQTLPSSSLDDMLKLANAVEEERNLYLEKLQAEERKTQKMEEKIQTLEQERDALKNQATTVQTELHNMTELCQQKEQALQQKAVQAEWVQTERDAEIQRARMWAMEEEHEKRQCSYKAQIEFQEQQALENLMKAWRSEQALTEERKMTVNLQNQLDGVNAQLAQFLQPVSEPTPSCSFQQLPPFLSDFEEIPLLDLTAESAPSPSTTCHTGSQSWSLLEVEGNQPAQRPRWNSLASMSLSTMNDKGFIIEKQTPRKDTQSNSSEDTTDEK